MIVEPQRNMFHLYIVSEDGSLSVDGVISQDVSISLASEFGSLYDSSNNNPLGKALALVGAAGWTQNTYTTVTVQGSTQIWKGSSAGQFGFELNLVTEDDPVKDVRDKMITLYKMVTPTMGDGKVILGQTLSLIQASKPVTIDIPGVLKLKDYYVVNVSATQSQKLMRAKPGSPPLPMKALMNIEVIPKKMILRNDISAIFPNGTTT